MSNPLYRRNADRTDDEMYWRGMMPEAEAKRAAAAKAEAAQHQAESAARAAAREAEWTVETTKARREAWNALVRSGALNGKNGKIDMFKVRDQQKAQGWTMDDLKMAIQKHGL